MARRTLEELEEEVRWVLAMYWTQYGRPVALTHMSRRFSRSASNLNPSLTFYKFIDGLVSKGLIYVHTTPRMARFAIPGDVWRRLSDEERARILFPVLKPALGGARAKGLTPAERERRVVVPGKLGD